MAKLSAAQRTPAETRLIMVRIVICSFVLFFNAVSTSFIDAFLPDIMVRFGAAETSTKAGKAAAWITAGFCFGRFLSANLWGLFIDKYGRKKGLLIILGALTVCTLLFGVCNSYYSVMAIRFTTGFLNGLSIVGKTLSMEICPDDLKPWSISVTNSIWSLGSITGPVFGSLLYKRIESYPILASAMAVAFLGIILFPICWYFLEETLPAKSELNKPGENQKVVPSSPSLRLGENDNEAENTDMELADVKKGNEDNSELITKEENQSKLGLFQIPNVGKLMFIFSFNTFYAVVFPGLIIFWVSAKYEDGGLDFAYHQISQIFLYFTIPQLAMQILAYPYIQKKMGDYWMLNLGHLIHLPVFFFIPFAHMFGKGAYTVEKLWIVLWLFVRNMASFMNFSALQRFTNDVVSPDKRGRLNGLQVTCSSGLQVTGPFIGKWLLSWSMTNGLSFPFDYHFVFLFMCALTVGVIMVVNSLKFVDASKLKLIGENTPKAERS